MAQTPLLEGQHTGEFLVSSSRGHRSFDRGTLNAGQNLAAGSVLGKLLFATPTVPAPVGTGNGVMSGLTFGAGVLLGSYVLRMTSATTFNITGPNGEALTPGLALGAYVDAELSFTLTAGSTAFVAGDMFTVVVAAGSGAFTQWNPAALDGSEIVAGVLYANVNATLGNTFAAIVTRAVEVNGSELQWNTALNLGQIAAGQTSLSALGIIVR